MKTLIILKAGSKLPALDDTSGDFHDWILKGYSAMDFPVTVINVTEGEVLPQLDYVAGIVVTGSSAMVTEKHPWAEQTANWLRVAAKSDIPTLGICFGHQLLAYALGGDVQDNPNGIEVGTVSTVLCPAASDDELFIEMPKSLDVQASHKQSVQSLPRGAVRLAASQMDANHAFKVGDCVWGLQFHPEFDASITRHYVEYYREPLAQQGRNVDEIKNNCHDSSYGNEILRRFFDVVSRLMS
ncbi:glutamine amidotransferase [Kaarinaea lacus]